jgi:hypothetical protein
MRACGVSWKNRSNIALLFVTCLFPLFAEAAGREWYLNWGYNRNFWSTSDIHISQPALGNNFTIHDVRATDYPQWTDSGSVFNKDLSVPQFNLRFGWFIDTKREWAWEISLDHSKYNTTLDQVARVTGTIAGQPVDYDQALTGNYFNYRLHNGVNHLMLSLLKRTPLWGDLNTAGSASWLAKGGAGLIIPHAESTIMGNESDVGPKKTSNAIGTSSGWWQLNGWTAGAEIALRIVLFKPVYLELANKVAYAHLWNIPVYQGRADQSLWLFEPLFAIGFTMNGDSEEANAAP